MVNNVESSVEKEERVLGGKKGREVMHNLISEGGRAISENEFYGYLRMPDGAIMAPDYMGGYYKRR